MSAFSRTHAHSPTTASLAPPPPTIICSFYAFSVSPSALVGFFTYIVYDSFIFNSHTNPLECFCSQTAAGGSECAPHRAGRPANALVRSRTRGCRLNGSAVVPDGASGSVAPRPLRLPVGPIGAAAGCCRDAAASAQRASPTTIIAIGCRHCHH